MNFDSFAAKIQASAIQAAMAARSFQGFDQMAAQDDYIHSDDLNVNRLKTKQEASRENHVSPRETQIGPLHMEQAAATAISNVWPKSEGETRPDKHGKNGKVLKMEQHSSNYSLGMTEERAHPVTSADSSERSTRSMPYHNAHRSAPARQVTMPLLSVVRSALTTNDTVPVDDSLSSDDDSSTASDNSLNDRDDPVFSLLKPSRRGVQISKPLPTNEHGMQRDNYSSRQASTKSKKNSNRFMEDLDHRVSKENQVSSLDIEAQTPVLTSRQTRKKGFLAALWSTTSKEGMNTPAPLARERVREETSIEETFDVNDASNLLSDHELQQLNQFKESRKLGLSMALIQYGMEHPRETFIMFTMVVGVFVYFYTRSISAEDDVT